MARTIITTCGTSLKTASAWEDQQCQNGLPLAKITDPEERHLMSGIYAGFTARFRLPQDLAAQFDRQCWDDISRLGKLSAELASLRALAHYYENAAQPPQPLGAGDRAIFLYSDNEDGRFCAHCIRIILETYHLLPEVVIDFQEISGLDPQVPAAFQAALQNLWSVCLTTANNLPPGHRLIFNLTGGYKAMGLIPAALSTIVQRTPSPSIVYFHETAGPEQLLIFSYDKKNRTIDQWLVAGFYEPTTAHVGPGIAWGL